MSTHSVNTTALAVRRWAVISFAALTGILVFVSMLIDPVPDADGKELILGYAAEPFRQGLHTNVIHYGFALMAPVAYAMVGLVRGRGAWLASIGGLLAILGLSTLPGLVLIDYHEVAVNNVAGISTAVEVGTEVESMMGFLPLLIPAIFASMLATPILAIAAVRAGLMRWWVPVVLVVGAIAPQFLAIPGFAMWALGSIVLADALRRIPLEHWFGGALASTQAANAANGVVASATDAEAPVAVA